MSMRNLLLLEGILLITFINCKNMTDIGKEILINTESFYTYRYEIVNERIISQEVGGNEKLYTTDSSKMIFSFCKLVNNSKRIVHFDSFNHYNKFRELHSPNEPSPFERSLIAFKDLEFQLEYISPKKIKHIYGYENFKNKIDSLYKQFSAKEDTLNLPSKSVFTEQYFKDIFENKMFILPDMPIYVGSRWINMDSTRLINEYFEIKLHSAVEKYRNGIIFLKTTGNVDKLIMIRGQSPINIKAEQKGEIEIDAGTGMILNSENILHMKGSAKNGINTILIDVTNNFKIRGTKYKN